MKTTRILSLAMTMAMGMIAGLQASVTDHRPPAPLPEFKTPEQLAKWRSETTAKTSAQEASRLSTLDSSTPFYTGKPYLAESGSYAFKYREYNPVMGRWTTVDPSGFPDGANNRMYAAVPTSELDPNGNNRTPFTLSYVIVGVGSVQWNGYAVWSYDSNMNHMIDHSLVPTTGLTGVTSNITFESSDLSNTINRSPPDKSGKNSLDEILLYGQLVYTGTMVGQNQPSRTVLASAYFGPIYGNWYE